ncbi:MAG TPA: NAD(P) transhydrogenase subunit alpha [Azospirillaceae bacterium]|nr:NAD(P) transhydrogenase subunit alpha [Azospirillaceae bacterium]
MNPQDLLQSVAQLQAELAAMAQRADVLATQVAQMSTQAASTAAASGDHGGFFMVGLTVFVLACFVGYYVVWRVTPALHSPLMAVTNAVSSVIIVGALIAAGPAGFSLAKLMGFLAVILASVNIFGGFIVTQRMLSMFKKKK